MKLSLLLLAVHHVSASLHFGQHPPEGRAKERDASMHLMIPPPVATIIPYNLTIHNDTRVDNYFWLNSGRDDPDVLQYLEEENNYTDQVMAHTVPLQEALFDEIKGRIKQDDSSVPILFKNYYYYRRYEEEKEYPFHCRRRNVGASFEQAGGEECVNVNDYAEGYTYYDFMGPTYNGNEQVAACSYDDVGRLFFTIFFLEKEKEEETATAVNETTTPTNATNATTSNYTAFLPSTTYTERLENVTYNYAWAADNTTFFYTKQDPVTLRWYQIWRHTLGTQQEEDVMVYQEEDEEYDCGVQRTKSNAYVIIYCYKTLTREYRYIDALRPTQGDFEVFWPRQDGHDYWIQHAGDYWYIITNDPDTSADNYKLMKTPVVGALSDKEEEDAGEEGDKKKDNKEEDDDDEASIADKEDWIEIIPHRNDTLLWWFDVFINHIVVLQRFEGLRQIRIIPTDEEQEEHYLDFGEPVYYSDLGSNYQYNTSVLRYEYESFTTPDSVFDYNMNTREKTLLKQDEVIDENFAPTNYVSKRLFAIANDGSRIPISMVYKKDIVFESDGDDQPKNHPLLQKGYGAYGSSYDADFRINRLSLLDRGFIFAYAHVRGGQEMGAHWYEQGKLLQKKNTFTDFIAASEYLIHEGYTSPEKLYCYGASAGGLLVGAVVTMAPHLYHGAIADVPWVDAVTTMLDETIPLVSAEWSEWGNPKDPEYYEYMLSYSPYDQVAAQDYPNLLVYAGLHDSQVQYWEPAKWVAKLRTHKTDDNLLLLKTNMEAGHYGNTGRFQVIKETAFYWAFLLDLAGLNDQEEIEDESMINISITQGEDGSISVGGSINVEKEQDTDEGEVEGTPETVAADDSSTNVDVEVTDAADAETGGASWGGDLDDLDIAEDIAVSVQSASARQFGIGIVTELAASFLLVLMLF